MRWWQTLGIVCVGIVVLALAFPVVAIGLAKNMAAGSLAGSAQTITEATWSGQRTADLGVRKFPLLSEAVEQAVSPDGVTVDPAAVDAQGRATADKLGLDWNTLLTYPPSPPSDAPSHFDRPLTYPEIDRFITAQNAGDLVRTQPDEAIDLASLLVLADAEYAGGLAQALLQFDKGSRSCERMLNRAYVVHLGRVAPLPRRTEAYLADVRAACGEDNATAQWLLASFERAEVPQLADCAAPAFPLPEPPDEALAAARNLRERFPDLAAGYVAEADVLMLQASEEARFNLKPFTARTRWSQAAALLAEAKARSDDPEIVLAQARALAGMGQTAHAARLIAALTPQDMAHGGAALLASWVLAQDGQFDQALAYRTEAPRPARTLVPEVQAYERIMSDLPAIGWLRSMASSLQD
ncbi:MAG: hypothetical protein Q4F67_08425, partial [Propionibacteriaceae bacterium]|nr:hypothetical protein [Propionibacteriaceae bacterium]